MSAGPAGSAAQQRYLATSLKEVRAAFAREVSGVWTEVLPVLVAQEWERAAAGLSAGSLKNCMDSVQAWMQVTPPSPLAPHLLPIMCLCLCIGPKGWKDTGIHACTPSPTFSALIMSPKMMVGKNWEGGGVEGPQN